MRGFTLDGAGLGLGFVAGFTALGADFVFEGRLAVAAACFLATFFAGFLTVFLATFLAVGFLPAGLRDVAFFTFAGFFAFTVFFGLPAFFATLLFGRATFAAALFFVTRFFAIPRPPLRPSAWHVGGKAASI